MAERIWAEKWKRLDVPIDEREVQLLNWLKLEPGFFKGKSVLDAGCGNGANSLIFLKWGASKVTCIDWNADIIAKARLNLQEYRERVEFEQKDIEDCQIEKQYDAVACIGVLHHLKNSRKALELLWGCVKPGGRLLVWVYGSYNNELKLVYAIRTITSRLPFSINRVLAHPLTVAMGVIWRLGRKPYYLQLRKFRYRHVYEIVLDQIIPKTAEYYSEREIRRLIENLPLAYEKDANLAGWLIRGRKA